MLKETDVQKFKAQLTVAFKAMRKAGFVARQNFWCCQSCAWADLGDKYPEREHEFVFYHKQDTERIPSGAICLAWDSEHPELIISALVNAGLKVQWDGTSDKRIEAVFVG